MFLSNTLNGVIKRFEDEFPDTRVSNSAASTIDLPSSETPNLPPNSSIPKIATPTPAGGGASLSDEDEPDPATPTAIKSPCLSRSNSLLSLSSKALAHEEGRILRAGHKFRVGVVADAPFRPEHYALLTSGLEMVGADPNHARMLHDLLEELGDEELDAEVREKGVVAVFKERRAEIRARLRAADPAHWDRFVESQEMARANAKVEGVNGVEVGGAGAGEVGAGGANVNGRRSSSSNETAVED